MGLEYQVGYTFSKGMTDAQGYYGSPGQAAGTGPYTPNIYNKRAEWAPTFFDNKHNLTGSFVYGLPFGHKRAVGANWNGPIDVVFGRMAVRRHLHRAFRVPVDGQSLGRSFRYGLAQRARERDWHAERPA